MFWQLCLHHVNTGEQKVYLPLLRYAFVPGECCQGLLEGPCGAWHLGIMALACALYFLSKQTTLIAPCLVNTTHVPPDSEVLQASV